MNGNKPKRDPEQELRNRGLIKVVLYGTVGTVMMLVVVFILTMMIYMLQTIIVGIVMMFALDIFQPIQDLATLFLVLAMGSLAVAGIIQYDTYNEERISELKTIVGSEEK